MVKFTVKITVELTKFGVQFSDRLRKQTQQKYKAHWCRVLDLWACTWHVPWPSHQDTRT